MQCLGWATFEIIIIAAALTALSDELLGVGGNAFWTLVTGAVALLLALMGPVGVVRRGSTTRSASYGVGQLPGRRRTAWVK